MRDIFDDILVKSIILCITANIALAVKVDHNSDNGISAMQYISYQQGGFDVKVCFVLDNNGVLYWSYLEDDSIWRSIKVKWPVEFSQISEWNQIKTPFNNKFPGSGSITTNDGQHWIYKSTMFNGNWQKIEMQSIMQNITID
jgi:hypothetical protein